MKEKEPKEKTPIKNTDNKALKSWFVKIGIVAAAFLVAFCFLVLILNISFTKLIFPRTIVGGIDLGGKNQKQANEIIIDQVQKNQNRELVLNFNDKQFKIKPEEIDLKYNSEASSEIGWAVGRNGNYKKIFIEQMKTIIFGNRFDLIYEYNDEKLQAIISRITGEIDQPEKDATILIDQNLLVSLEAEKIGRRVSQDKLQKDIFARLGNLKADPNITLLIGEAFPKIKAEEATETLELTKEILKNTVIFKTEKKDFTLKPEEYASWLDFIAEKEGTITKTWVLKIHLKKDKVDAYLENVAKEIDQEARDAKFNMENGKVTAFQLSQTGYELDRDQAAKNIETAIISKLANAELPVKVVKPEITSNSSGEIGVKEVVGQATTNFYNSAKNRRHNIATGAKALHGIIVKPGEEFSTVKNISPVNADNGYLPELVILDNQTRPEYGGGLCQVSSTLFRTALNAGLEITERKNHSYRVPYYEPPIGMDATIYEPSPDFRFKNNMDHPILIQASVDDGASAITFTFYGTKDKRIVEMTKPVAYAYTAPPDPIYTEDPNLAPGEIKKVDTAHAGAKADFQYKVTLNGKVLQDTNFHSEYTNWAAKYLYGPGTQIPPAS